MIPAIDPDCRNEKHHNCGGFAWSDEANGFIPCECECHAEPVVA